MQDVIPQHITRSIRRYINIHLIEYTGLDGKCVVEMIKNPQHVSEWNTVNPKSQEEINWFYKTSKTYLFANARHKVNLDVFERVQCEKNVLDFGGGAGTMSFALSLFKKCHMYYWDLNIIEQDFVRFVSIKNSLSSAKKRLDIKVLEPTNIQENHLDYIIALDVFEHLKDYRPILKTMSELLRKGGELITLNSFDNTEPSHFKDLYGFKNECKKVGLSKVSVYDKSEKNELVEGKVEFWKR